MKNTQEESGKCKVIIQIDGEQVFISDSYEWKYPNTDRTEFGFSTGGNFFDSKKLKGSIKNVQIIVYD